MSRVYEVLTKQAEEQKQQSEQKQQVVTIEQMLPTAPITPEERAQYLAELDRFREAARANAKGFLMGSALLFKKGKWLLGRDKNEIADGTNWIALMNLASNGYLRWNADKTATHRDVGKISEGWVLPDRSTLPDRDPAVWPSALSGKCEDPWKECCYLPLVSPDGETMATFATNTPTGVNAFWRYIERYGWLAHRHPGADPIVALEAGGYNDRRYGWVDTPGFRIVGWVGRAAAQKLIGVDGGDDNNAAAEPLLKDELSDEIPF
jgi:hypothetical protein